MSNSYSEDNENGGGLKTKAGEKVRELSEVARSQASERVRQISDKAREKAQERVEDQRERIAGKVDEVASGLLQHAEEGDNLRYQAERRVAHELENAASYLHSHQTTEVAGDVGSYVRQHPVRSMIMAAIIGFLLGKLLG